MKADAWWYTFCRWLSKPKKKSSVLPVPCKIDWAASSVVYTQAQAGLLHFGGCDSAPRTAKPHDDAGWRAGDWIIRPPLLPNAPIVCRSAIYPCGRDLDGPASEKLSRWRLLVEAFDGSKEDPTQPRRASDLASFREKLWNIDLLGTNAGYIDMYAAQGNPSDVFCGCHCLSCWRGEGEWEG